MRKELIPTQQTRRFGWVDVFVIIFSFGLLYFLLTLGSGMEASLIPEQASTLSLDPAYLPYYAGRSLLRMFLAFGLSLMFTFIYGRIAAYNKRASIVMVPLLDILQSIPVLGFLSVTVTGLIGLFPGSMIGPELASIFAIFTGQAWNMTFSFYYSLTSIPSDLREVSSMTQMSRLSQFAKIEVPYSMIGLVWNSMMSFGGGWFFLAASEAITVLGKDIKLPGIGSYMATAIDQGDLRAIYLSIVTIIMMILLVDQFFWRPLVAWSQKFKIEQSEGNIQKSWFLDLLRRSVVISLVQNSFRKILLLVRQRFRKLKRVKQPTKPIHSLQGLSKMIKFIILLGIIIYVGKHALEGLFMVLQLSQEDLVRPLILGCYTFLRVLLVTLLGTLWTVPVGVAIGLNPKLARFAQPLVQIAASFPANMVFPFVILFYLKYHISIEIGAIPLMMLGTQWYILFNVIAGTLTIPNDLKEASTVLGLNSLEKWKRLILPAIFPFLVTGWITASGGAWNASIVSEIVSWKNNDLAATGLGAYITTATNKGNWPEIIWGITVMALIVVLTNRLIWRKLYTLANEKFNIA